MAKIQYPNDGLVITAGGHSQQAIDSFNEAIRNCDFDVPYDFPYRDWIYGLRRELERCRDNIQSYHEKITSADKENQDATSESSSLVQRLEPITIENRQRIIKE